MSHGCLGLVTRELVHFWAKNRANQLCRYATLSSKYALCILLSKYAICMMCTLTTELLACIYALLYQDKHYAMCRQHESNKAWNKVTFCLSSDCSLFWIAHGKEWILPFEKLSWLTHTLVMEYSWQSCRRLGASVVSVVCRGSHGTMN